MITTRNRLRSFVLGFIFLSVAIVLTRPIEAGAAQLQLTWVDNSTNEDGFGIERKTGITGTYGQIATVGVNVTSYTDSTLLNGATYCYRVFAFNSSGTSPYSPESCGTTPSVIQTFGLSVVKAGTGSGTVTSSPAGINCGTTCSANFNGGTTVTLSATAASGSAFAGWTGTGCTTGSVTMNAATSCTATFNLQTPAVNTVSTNISNGAVLSGSSVIWTATPTGSPVRVEFLIDNVLSWTENLFPYVFNGDTGVLNTTTLTNGSHQLKVRAVYGDNSTAELTISVTVSNSSTQQFALSVVKAGTGSGTVTSSPTGINCGTTCSASFNSGTTVTLSATAASGSTFAGWTGTGCTTGSVTMNAATSCTATFNLQTQTFGLSVVKAGTGNGTVTSSPTGINCGSTCTAIYNSGTTVALSPAPASGSTFAGWSGTGCSTGTVTMDAAKNCSATFATASQPINQLATRIGVFRPATGEWFLDHDGNSQWDPNTDIHITSFGHSGDLPVIGSWSGNGLSNIGTFTPATGTWQLDINGDGVLNCAVDRCLTSFGQPGDFPVTREMSGLNGSIIGTYTPETVVTINGRKRIKRGQWKFDLNDNSAFDGCTIDECDTFGDVGEIPVVGDWNGTGSEEIGLFVPSKGNWYLDLSGNETWDGCRRDKCLGTFGQKGDLPVVGDWDGTGKIRIGVFRPSTGMWYLDINGNGKLDGCKTDACMGPFGQPGDLPVVGKW